VIKKSAIKNNIMLTNIKNNKRDILQDTTIHIQCQLDYIGDYLIGSTIIFFNHNLFKQADSVQFEILNKRDDKA
jgi:hypothetical protein